MRVSCSKKYICMAVAIYHLMYVRASTYARVQLATWLGYFKKKKKLILATPRVNHRPPCFFEASSRVLLHTSIFYISS